jgi:opacity protein-like surface antigen
MTTKRIAKLLGLFAGALFSAAAYSQLYVGGSLGSANLKDFCTERPVDCDKNGTAWRAFVGYGFTPNFAIEGAFIDFGRTNATDAGAAKINSQNRGGELLGVFAYRANKASIFAKAGGYYAATKLTVESGGGSWSRTSQSSGGFTYGLGAQYELTSHIGVRADWQRYAKVGGSDTGGASDVDAFLIGAVWTFH